MRIIYKHILLSCLILISCINVMGQSGMSIYGLQVIPQSNFTNPAFIPKARLVVGIPFISSISNSTYSSSFSFNDIFVNKEGSDSLYFNLSSVANNSNDINYVTQYFENDLLYLGFKINRSYLNIGIRNRLYSRAIYSTDLAKLLWDGNASYVDQPMDLSSSFVNHDHFISYYVGLGFMIGDNVSLGLRANINQGLSSVQTISNNFIIETIGDPESVFSLKAKTGFEINTSGLVSDSTKPTRTTTDYIFNFQNIGFSFDFGADFKLSNQVNLNFSILDLGYIKWNSDLRTYENIADTVQFSGIYADIDSGDDIFKAYGDSLANLIEINEFENSFKTNLPTRVFLGLQVYSYDHRHRFGFAFAGTFLKDNFSPAASVSYDMTVSKHFTFKLSYNYLRYSPFNIGSGLVFNFKPFQFYILTDNIMSAIKWSDQKYINFMFGINLVFPDKQGFKKGEPVIIKR